MADWLVIFDCDGVLVDSERLNVRTWTGMMRDAGVDFTEADAVEAFVGKAYKDNRVTLTELTGVAPRFFRSGTAHYDDVAVRIAGDLGEAVVNFDVNGDAGATFGPREVTAALGSVSAGSIVIGHMNQPSGGTAAGVAAALPRLTAEGFRFVRLSEHL